MKKRLFFLLPALLCVFGLFAQDAVISRMIEIGTTDNQTTHWLDILSNRIGGRPIGSDAYNNAVTWTASKFKEWGMEVSIEEAGEVPVGFNRGPWFGRMLSDNGMILHFATPSYTAGTKGVQKGHVWIEPKSRSEFLQMKGALKGAWVLIGGNSTGRPIDTSPRADSLRAKTLAYNDSISLINREIMMEMRQTGVVKPLLPLKEEPALLYKELCEAGILGIIQSAPLPIIALSDRSVAMNPQMSFETLPTVCDIKLDEHQYAVIYQMAKERRNFELEFDIRNHFKPGPVKYHNVIGIIRGSKYPNEYVMVSGHLDSYDVATGGVDCGVGVTPAMEAARLIMKAGGKPQRTILFCLFAGEEFGLLGAQAYVKQHKKELDKISNLFNRDGGPTVPTGISVPESMYDDFVKVCAPINRINPDFPFTVQKAIPRPRPTSFGGTDATVFAVEGVPTFGFSLADTKGYNFAYNEIWHTERDTFNKSIPEYQEHTSVVTAIVAFGLANLDHLLSRKGMYVE
ncbi:MAG: M20/M25/M40 family metallo-hydrolase [Bacteroidetes bacterium]|nr:M20/M25/M40 family metallo-hydrolase [Bacteroidota bacterium]